ncbi:MAG: GNAT family N-acetyltransferase [Chloroflexi bacterium]|nr:MAG: GNAT family N-acetyltransferase [Chloroflexota bacterium]
MPQQLQITPDSIVSLREVTHKNLSDVIELSDTLSEAHRHMVASNAVSIAQAHFSPHAWFQAIYADEVPVGFLMLHIGADDHWIDYGGFFLWRMMIAAPYQRMGFGKRALELVIDHIARQGVDELRTSCGEGEGSPEGFYRSLGFESDGDMYDDEVGLTLKF